VVVSSSRSEGFPQIVLEAMALGLPVVATAVGGTPEIVISEETGILVPPDDPERLAIAVDRVLTDPALARRLGERARSHVHEAGLTKEAMVDRLRSIYLDLVTTPR
jgi:glycosyltransferase involved in cell wall biosynthesis